MYNSCTNIIIITIKGVANTSPHPPVKGRNKAALISNDTLYLNRTVTIYPSYTPTCYILQSIYFKNDCSQFRQLGFTLPGFIEIPIILRVRCRCWCPLLLVTFGRKFTITRCATVIGILVTAIRVC